MKKFIENFKLDLRENKELESVKGKIASLEDGTLFRIDLISSSSKEGFVVFHKKDNELYIKEMEGGFPVEDYAKLTKLSQL